MNIPEPQPLLTAALARHYDLTDVVLTPVHGGQNTVNLRATGPDGHRFFVKTYLPGTDLRAEREAIALTERAAAHGVPTAPIRRDRNGHTLHADGTVTFSVWGWVEGTVVTRPDPEHCTRAGRALGQIHAAFGALPVTVEERAEALSDWRTIEVDALTEMIDRLLKSIADRAEQDAFDETATATLVERRAMLTHLPDLARRVNDVDGELTVQVLHGDYSPVNLLYTPERELAAVLDFCPPRAAPAAYDLGRMAFFPNTVTASDDWMALARTFITSYLEAHPRTREADVRSCGRIALLQLLRSLYGVKQHYLAPGIDQAALDEFWLLRHRTVRTLLERTPDIDHMLDDLARCLS